MVTICSICLESKINLQTIGNENLENFYDELCDYDNGFKSKFCCVCLHKLRKCYEFKKYCHLSAKTLNSWMKQNEVVTLPKHLLYTKMPAPQLSLCNKNNYKVYFFQTADLDVTADPIQISNSKSPHIVTVNIPRDLDNFLEKPGSEFEDDKDDEKFLKKELDSDPIIKVEYDLQENEHDNEIVEMVDVFTIKSENAAPVVKKRRDEIVSDEDESDDDDDDDFKASLKDSDSDSLSELEDEPPKPKRSKRISSEKPRQTRKKNDTEKKPKTTTKRINAKELKVKLKEKFKKIGTVKDEKGNTIDTELVLNNLDKTSLATVQKLCLAPGPFSPEAINKLAEIHQRFAHDSLFDKIRIETQHEIKLEFEKRRESVNYTKNSHHCDSCLKGFPSQALLDYHIKIGHNESYQFECPICHMRMNTRKRYRTHSYTHNTVFKCKLCPFITGSRSIMIPHVNKHQGVKYPCEQCGNVYSDIRARAAHRNREHAPQHICPLCAHAFTFASGLKFHHVKKHQGEEFVESENNKKCDECNILFISNEIYNKHVKLTHEKQETAGQEKPKITRKRDKNKKNIYTCRLCEWKGLGRLLQIQHYQTEHPGASIIAEGAYKYLCHDCGKQFKCVTAYTGHMNKHKGTRPYACPKCPKTFFSRLVLDSHVLRHLPPSKECPHCGKKFTTPTGLRGHVRTHGTDRRYICNICGKGFLFSGALREHVTGVHHNIRRKKTRHTNNIDCMDSE